MLLCACFIEAVWLLVAQTMGSMLLLVPCLLCFLALVVWAAIKNVAMPLMLFFLPFAPLLKQSPDTISFFTVALLLVYMVYTVTGSRQARVLHLIPALLLVALTLVVKTAYGYEMDNSYLLFAVTLMLVPFLSRELDGGYGFIWLTVCFALGICLAAITAQFLMVFPTISRYIDINTALGMIRRSGYYGDPNFYSCHITAALSGLLALLLNMTKKWNVVLLAVLVCALLYCGLMSVSKSFLLISACLFLLWVAELLLRKGEVSVKLTVVFTLIVIGVFLLSSTVFTDMLGQLLSRFGQDTNLSEFTTGRIEVWTRYITAMVEDPWLLLFGQGYTNIFIGEKPPHNTIIQVVYQFGLIGLVLFVTWLVFFMQILLGEAKIHRHQIAQLALLLIGAFGPWMALDYVFFDEFFLFPIYVCAAVRYMAKQERQAESPLLGAAAADALPYGVGTYCEFTGKCGE
ncbi:MAG: O-antigen ligase family protein [Clostridia bacterium]|nr:O-antigen ligase family protein [Clostridia bacterium]